MSSSQSQPFVTPKSAIGEDGEPLTGWQPIETAPKDGTLIIIGFYRPNVFEGPGDGPQSWCCLGRYDANDKPPLTASAWQNNYGQGFSWTPTHWMPLPAPPTA